MCHDYIIKNASEKYEFGKLNCAVKGIKAVHEYVVVVGLGGVNKLKEHTFTVHLVYQ